MANRKKKPATTETITAYKGFDKNLKCRDFQFEIGGTFTQSGDIKACSNGFHACEHPLDVLTYYPAATSRFAEVELSGDTSREVGKDTKIAAATITIKAEISLGEIGRGAVAWVQKICASATASHAAGDYGHASAAGYYGHASAAGDYGHASAAGTRGHASSAGTRGHASAAGYYGHASAAGDYGHASSAGDYGHASSAGYYGHASAAGYYGHASSAGTRGHASVTGKNSVASAHGLSGTAMAVAGSAISLAAYDTNGKLICVKAAMVGADGVEAGKTYRLTIGGVFVEVVNP